MNTLRKIDPNEPALDRLIKLLAEQIARDYLEELRLKHEQSTLSNVAADVGAADDAAIPPKE